MKDIVKKKDEDLVKELREKREELRQFRFGTAGARTRNVKEGRNLRKDIARILTEMSARVKSGAVSGQTQEQADAA